MLHCAVCDDDKSATRVLQGMINEYDEALNCAVFFDPLILLSTVHLGQKFDFYILDIMMPSLTGIDLAREIRKVDVDCIIIFLTSSDEFHRDAFHVEALQYLIKPVDKTMLYHTLDRVLNYIGNKGEQILPIQTKIGIYPLSIKIGRAHV